MSTDVEKSLRELDFSALTRRKFTASPAAWEDQVVYFLLIDRFSDGNERGGYRDIDGNLVTAGATPLQSGDAGRVAYGEWLEAGAGWQGGTLAGLRSKLGYLRRLGVTTLWVSPVLRQVAFEESYHGYGAQNFLDVDPHFGTREAFRDFVAAAHDQGMYVVLDVVAHHAGNIFGYAADRYRTQDPQTGTWFLDPRWDGRPYVIEGFNDRYGRPTIAADPPDRARLEASWPDGAVWPREFQDPRAFVRRGRIVNWDHPPEYLEGDMFAFRTLDLHVASEGSYRRASSALACIALVYCFWIAYADVDGFRIDAAKHMGADALRAFCDAIREFAQSLGKERFLLCGEVTGGRAAAWEAVEKTGLDAALGIDDVPGMLERMVCGEEEPARYFSLFRNWVLEEQALHRWYRNKVVTLVDDHDQVRKGAHKRRLAGDPGYRDLGFNVAAVQLTTMGIPCIYYGTEQGFDSGGRPNASDVVLRENMFGGRFGGRCTQGHHFFDEEAPLYRSLAALIALRRELSPLRRGRQMLHEISGNGVDFGLPRAPDRRVRSIVSWSRLFADQEVLVALNTDQEHAVTSWSTVAPTYRAEGDVLRLAFWRAPRGAAAPALEVRVERRAGRLSVLLQLPPAGFAIYAAAPFLQRAERFAAR